MKCPSCGVACPEGALECASCGVIFAKFAEKRRREREEAEQALAKMNVPPPIPVDPHLGRKIGVSLAAAWMSVMSFFIVKELIRRHARQAAAAAAAATEAAAVAAQRAAPAPAVPVHAVIVDPAGQLSSPSGDSLNPNGR